MMTHAEIIKKLKSNNDVFRFLLVGLDKHEITWRPAPDKWCLLEIIRHFTMHIFNTRFDYAGEW